MKKNILIIIFTLFFPDFFFASDTDGVLKDLQTKAAELQKQQQTATQKLNQLKSGQTSASGGGAKPVDGDINKSRFIDTHLADFKSDFSTKIKTKMEEGLSARDAFRDTKREMQEKYALKCFSTRNREGLLFMNAAGDDVFEGNVAKNRIKEFVDGLFDEAAKDTSWLTPVFDKSQPTMWSKATSLRDAIGGNASNWSGFRERNPALASTLSCFCVPLVPLDTPLVRTMLSCGRALAMPWQAAHRLCMNNDMSEIPFAAGGLLLETGGLAVGKMTLPVWSPLLLYAVAATSRTVDGGARAAQNTVLSPLWGIAKGLAGGQDSLRDDGGDCSLIDNQSENSRGAEQQVEGSSESGNSSQNANNLDKANEEAEETIGASETLGSQVVKIVGALYLAKLTKLTATTFVSWWKRRSCFREASQLNSGLLGLGDQFNTELDRWYNSQSEAQKRLKNTKKVLIRDAEGKVQRIADQLSLVNRDIQLYNQLLKDQKAARRAQAETQDLITDLGAKVTGLSGKVVAATAEQRDKLQKLQVAQQAQLKKLELALKASSGEQVKALQRKISALEKEFQKRARELQEQIDAKAKAAKLERKQNRKAAEAAEKQRQEDHEATQTQLGGMAGQLRNVQENTAVLRRLETMLNSGGNRGSGDPRIGDDQHGGQDLVIATLVGGEQGGGVSTASSGGSRAQSPAELANAALYDSLRLNLGGAGLSWLPGQSFLGGGGASPRVQLPGSGFLHLARQQEAQRRQEGQAPGGSLALTNGSQVGHGGGDA